MLIPALLLGLIGLWDDLKSLPAYPRLFAQSAVGVGISIILITTGTLGNPTGSIVLDVLLTVIWIVGICNSINFFDNMDGGAAGALRHQPLGAQGRPLRGRAGARPAKRISRDCGS